MDEKGGVWNDVAGESGALGGLSTEAPVLNKGEFSASHTKGLLSTGSPAVLKVPLVITGVKISALKESVIWM